MAYIRNMGGRIIGRLIFGVMVASGTVAVHAASLSDMEQQIAGVRLALAKDPRLVSDGLSASAAYFVPSFGAETVSNLVDQGSELSAKKIGTKAELSRIPIDLVLSRIAMQTGANHHYELKQAQARKNGSVVALRKGAFDLDSLYRAARKSGLADALSRQDGHYRVNLPIFIMDSASLTIEPGERLELSRDQGAFIINMGKLVVSQAKISGSNGRANKVSDFRPFVMTALGGIMEVRNSQISDLGFADRPAMRGLSFVSSPFFPIETRFVLKGNEFKNLHSVELIGVDQFDVASNYFMAMQSSAIRIQNARNGSIRNNVIVDSKNHGLHLLQETKAVRLVNNIVTNGQGAGIYIGTGAADVRILDNILLDNKKSGLSLTSASCTDIRGNAFLENGLRGVMAKTSQDVQFSKNIFAHNEGPAISIEGKMVKKDTLSVSQNRFIKNKSGLRADQFSKLELIANDFSQQLPVLFSGEVDAVLPRYLTEVDKLSRGSREPFVVSGVYLPDQNASSPGSLSISSLAPCRF